VKVLLMRGEVNPDKADDDGQALLSHAAAHGCEEVVKILLMREDVNPDKPITLAKQRSPMPLRMGVRKWWKTAHAGGCQPLQTR